MAPVYNLAEVKKHAKEDDCWIIVHGKVYDVTKFLDEHPGGFDIIITNTGKSISRIVIDLV
jgi:cytochrome b5